MPDNELIKPSASILIDGRDMQPPEPLEKAVAALETLQPGAELRMLLYCHPVPLFNILRENGYVWQESTLEDGTHEIVIRHA